MTTIWALVGVWALILAVADVVSVWKTRGTPRDEFCFQDWQAEERRQRIADFKAPDPGPHGFLAQGERRMRRRSS